MAAEMGKNASRGYMIVTKSMLPDQCHASLPRFGIGWKMQTRQTRQAAALRTLSMSGPAGIGGQECHKLLAGEATGRFEAIHLRVVLAAEAAVGGLSVLVFAGTIVESGVRIDPHLDAGVSLNMDDGVGSFGESERYQRPLPRAKRCPPRRARCRP